MNENLMKMLADKMFEKKEAETVVPETHDCSCQLGFTYDQNSEACKKCYIAGKMQEDVMQLLLQSGRYDLAFKLMLGDTALE